MEKGLCILLLLLIAAIQAIHLAFAYKYIKYQNQLDDTNGTPYNQYNSQTTSGTYSLAFYCVAAGFSALAYIILAILKAGSSSLNPKLQYNLYLLVALLQFTFAVIFALDSSSNISPSSSNAGATEQQINYKTMYWLQLSDAVITWVICVTGSTALLLMNESDSMGQQVQQNSTTIIRN